MQRPLVCFPLLALIVLLSASMFALADESHPALKALQKKLQETNPKLAEEFEEQLQRSLQEVKKYHLGHVVFGRVQVKGGKDPRSVVSQMIILQDGYFVDAVGAVQKPIGFSLNGFETALATPEGPGPIEDLGVIKLNRLPPERLCAVTGRLHVESHPMAPKPEKLTVAWELSADPINTPSNNTQGITQFFRPITSKVAADGTFTAGELSPCKFMMHINAAHCVQYFQEITLEEGKTKDLGVINLEVVRKMDVEYGVSKDGDFNNLTFRKMSLKANDRWRAGQSLPPYAFDLLIGQKEGKLVFDHRFGPCHIEDLGAAQLDDELAVDLKELQNKQPQSVPAEEGHVYVIYQGHWKHWILVRTTSVNEIATEKKK